MLNYIARRIGQSLVLLLIMSVLVFAGMYVVGDPVEVLASDDFNQADREALAQALASTGRCRCNIWPSSAMSPRAISASPSSITARCWT